jgi:signal peptidase II
MPAAIVAGVVVLDRITKLYIQGAYSSRDFTKVIPGFFYIDHVENPGAGFGMLADSQSAWRGVILVGVSLAVMAVIAVMLWRPQTSGARQSDARQSQVMRTGLALIFGGALGNLWDRMFRGTVTDFLQFFFGQYEFPSFNAADSMITIGAVLLLIDLWLTRQQPVPQRQNPNLTS